MASLAASTEQLVRNIQSSAESRLAGSNMRLLVDRARVVAAHGFLEEQKKGALERKKQMEQRRAEVCELRLDYHNFIERFGMERLDAARSLKTSLGSCRRDLAEAAQLDAERFRHGKNKRQAGMKELKADVMRHKNNVRRTIDDLAADHLGARRLWSEMRKKKARMVAAGRGTALAPVDSGLAGASELEASPSSKMRRVINVIQSHSGGIKLLEIGNELGVDWRGLTSVVKSLVDAGLVEKMEDVYYPGEEINWHKEEA